MLVHTVHWPLLFQMLVARTASRQNAADGMMRSHTLVSPALLCTRTKLVGLISDRTISAVSLQWSIPPIKPSRGEIQAHGEEHYNRANSMFARLERLVHQTKECCASASRLSSANHLPWLNHSCFPVTYSETFCATDNKNCHLLGQLILTQDGVDCFIFILLRNWRPCCMDQP